MVVMEAMRILKAVGAKPRRTIRIALWSGEEQALYGSREYVRSTSRPAPRRPPRKRSCPTIAGRRPEL